MAWRCPPIGFSNRVPMVLWGSTGGTPRATREPGPGGKQQGSGRSLASSRTSLTRSAPHPGHWEGPLRPEGCPSYKDSSPALLLAGPQGRAGQEAQAVAVDAPAPASARSPPTPPHPVPRGSQGLASQMKPPPSSPASYLTPPSRPWVNGPEAPPRLLAPRRPGSRERGRLGAGWGAGWGQAPGHMAAGEGKSIPGQGNWC